MLELKINIILQDEKDVLCQNLLNTNKLSCYV